MAAVAARDAKAMEKYADIVVPLARGVFTFSVDGAAPPVPGAGVEVVMGARKRYMGIVWRVHDRRPDFRIKPIARVLAVPPLLTPVQMRLWEWIASYYMCTLGDVMRFALPAALKPAGLTEEEFRSEEYRPVTVRRLRLGEGLEAEEAFRTACEALRRAPAQLALLQRIRERLVADASSDGVLTRSELGASSAPLADKLVARGFLREEVCEAAACGRRPFRAEEAALAPLTPAQQQARQELAEAFGERSTTLLWGVTGSGKTEIYLHLIADVLAQGGSVLYLMPEIAMTAQLVARVRRAFGDRVIVYHSKCTDRQRAEIYRTLLASSGGELVLGARSALFLPIGGLQLIIVDEEHDASYKQTEPAPRYHARDCAVWLAHQTGARCLLASATPSIETWVNARGGKYGFVRLTERYGEARLPQVLISDSQRAFRRGERKLHFDKLLSDNLRAVLDRGAQAILFQNRRGFAPWVECEPCGWVARCPRCSVTLTYHKQQRRLECHMCGYGMPLPERCPQCGTPSPQLKGLGTEKIEEEVAALFPTARIMRLDRDTASSPTRYRAIVEAFERGEADVLVGTQMLAKGFDFPQVELVGVLNADNLLNFPDFRAAERAFQLLTQVTGRAGRSNARGVAIIQTSQPDHTVIRQVQTLDYEGMVASQLVERCAFGYPPYGKLIVVALRHRDEVLVAEAAAWLAERMRRLFGKRVFGPHAPAVEKVNETSCQEILLKLENGLSVASVKSMLSDLLAEAAEHERYRKVFVYCDVDPQ